MLLWGAEVFSVVSMTVHITDVGDRVAANLDAIPIEGMSNRTGFYRRFAKRFLDITMVVLAAPFVLPFRF